MLEQTTSSISRLLNRHQQGAKIALTAVSASVLTAFALLGYQRFTRHRLSDKEEPYRQSSVISVINENQEKEPMDESLVLEFLARNSAFLGPEGVSKVRKSFVVVLGTGAVGSYAALMLVRSGVERVRIIDKGIVSSETLGCHALAKTIDVGKSKVQTVKKHLAGIAPNATVETLFETVDESNMGEMLSGNPDFVVDTLSNVKDKVLLAKYCKDMNIKIISSMSAGGKADPTQIQLTDVSYSSYDPLSRMYRRQLRKLKIDRDLPVVYSVEKSMNFTRVSDFDTRSLPILGPVSSMFGMALATYVVLQLSEFKAYDLPTNKGRDGVYSRIQKELAGKEEFTFGNKLNHMDANEIAYIFEEIWQGKSAFSSTQDRALVMTRWDLSKPSSLTNTILITKEEAKEHEALLPGTDMHKHYGAVAKEIEKQFKLEEKAQRLWRSC